MAEWLKARAWKVRLGLKPNGGSNPLPSAIFLLGAAMDFKTEPTFQFRGTKKQQDKLKQIFRLLLSVPSGHSVVPGVVKSRKMAKEKVWWLSHPSVSIRFGVRGWHQAGATNITNNEILLSWYGEDGHNMITHGSVTDDIMMASTLGHELRHVMTRYGYMSLMMYAQTKPEILLAKLLHEEDAYYINDRIDGELYADNDVLPIPDKLKEKIRKYNGPEGRVRHFKDVLEGNFRWVRYEQEKAKWRLRRHKENIDPEKSKMYQEMLKTWLDGMKIPMTPNEVLAAPILQIPVPQVRPNWFMRLFRGKKNVK